MSAEAIKCYVTLDSKLFEAYMKQKIEPIVAIIEPSMYVEKFDWARAPKPLDARDYVKEIIHNVMFFLDEKRRNFFKKIVTEVFGPRKKGLG